jgi:surface polysaccharide O-acyltransferase-like enzyme
MLFPPAARTAGYVFIIIGIYLIIYPLISETTDSNIFGGFLPLLIGIFMTSTTNGVLLDTENKTFKNYTNIFGYKQGSWRSIDPYPYIILLRHHISTYAHSKSNRTAQTSSHLYYDIYLIDASKRHKIHIQRTKDQEIAEESIRDLGDLLDVEIIESKP